MGAGRTSRSARIATSSELLYLLNLLYNMPSECCETYTTLPEEFRVVFRFLTCIYLWVNSRSCLGSARSLGNNTPAGDYAGRKLKLALTGTSDPQGEVLTLTDSRRGDIFHNFYSRVENDDWCAAQLLAEILPPSLNSSLLMAEVCRRQNWTVYYDMFRRVVLNSFIILNFVCCTSSTML